MTALASGEGGVVVTGLGMVTPVGYSAWPGAAALLAKMSGFVEVDSMHDQEGEPVVAAPIPRPDADPWSLADITAMAAAEAFAELSGVGPAADEPTWVCISHGPPDPDGTLPLGSYVLDRVQAAVKGLLPASDSIARPGDHTAVLEGLAEGADRIRRGAVHACLVGGTESLVSETRVAALDAADTLKTGYCPHGITPGEAAAFVLIESAEQARARGAQPLAVIAGAGLARGAPWSATSRSDQGQSLSQAIDQATGERREVRPWLTVVADLNGEPHRAREWAVARSRALRWAREIDLHHPADAVGEVGAAIGGVLVGLATFLLGRRFSPVPDALVWASAESGTRAAVFLTKPAMPLLR